MVRMTSEVEPLVRRLTDYALSKRGAQPDATWRRLYREGPSVTVAGAKGHRVFVYAFYTDDPPSVRFDLAERRVATLKETIPGAGPVPKWGVHEGIQTLDVPLDGSVDEAQLRALIDEAHGLAFDRVDGVRKLGLELALSDHGPGEILDTLVAAYGLSEDRTSLGQLVRPAIRWDTTRFQVAEPEPSVGSSKLGGLPDFAPGRRWPTDHLGRPLPFILQLDLAQARSTGVNPIRGLPERGLLSVFSLWGRIDPEECIPEPWLLDDTDQTDWNVLLYETSDELRRHEAWPKDVEVLEEARLQPTSTISLPIHLQDFTGPAINWDEERRARYQGLYAGFVDALGYRHQGTTHYDAPHLLGGYPLYPQTYPEDRPAGLRALLQVGSDDRTGLSWIDGGAFTLHVDKRGLEGGRFDRPWGVAQ